jgi:hypothetical protein
MRIPLLVLAALMILGGNGLILAIAGTIPRTIFAGGAGWACVAALLIVSGVGLVLWVNLRHVT